MAALLAHASQNHTPPLTERADDIQRTARAIREARADAAELVADFAQRAAAAVDGRSTGESDVVVATYSRVVRRLYAEDGEPAEHALCQAYLLWLWLGMVAWESTRPDTAHLAAGLARSLPVVVGHLRIAPGAAPDETDDRVAENVLTSAHLRGRNSRERQKERDRWLDILGILTY